LIASYKPLLGKNGSCVVLSPPGQDQASQSARSSGARTLHCFDAHPRAWPRGPRSLPATARIPSHRLNSPHSMGAHPPRVDSRSLLRVGALQAANGFAELFVSYQEGLGSSKWVVLFTTAFARASAILDLKIPEPTKRSAPSGRTSAASAGEPMPKAEKFGTGSFAGLANWRISRWRAEFLHGASIIVEHGGEAFIGSQWCACTHGLDDVYGAGLTVGC